MSYSLGIGGTERQIAEMALALRGTEFSPHVACFRDSGFRADELRRAGVPILHLPISSFGSWSALAGAATLRSYIRQHAIRLVHSFDYPTASFAIPLGRLFGMRAVLSSLRCHRDLVPGWHRRFTRITDRLSHGIVVNCKFLQRHLVRDEGVPESKIHLCYNGLDARRFPVARRRLPELEDAALVVGTVAVLRPEKGLDVLLDAFAALDFPGAKLVIVGSGLEQKNLESRAAKLSIVERLHFQPATKNVAEWLASFDIFVLPSHSEAFSNSLMEAMAAGCPVIASDVGGNPELVSTDTGLLFEDRSIDGLARCLRELGCHEQLRRRLGDRAAERVRELFSIDAAARTLGDIYRRFVQ
jgi:L-malate glycosyltransferase